MFEVSPAHDKAIIIVLATGLILSVVLHICTLDHPAVLSVRAGVQRMINSESLADRQGRASEGCASPICEASGKGYATHECVSGGCLGRVGAGQPSPDQTLDNVRTWQEAAQRAADIKGTKAFMHDRRNNKLHVWKRQVRFHRTLSGPTAFHILA